jgi:hypothetical protein
VRSIAESGWFERMAVIKVDSRGIHIEVVDIATTFPYRIPTSQKRYAPAVATAQIKRSTVPENVGSGRGSVIVPAMRSGTLVTIM